MATLTKRLPHFYPLAGGGTVVKSFRERCGRSARAVEATALRLSTVQAALFPQSSMMRQAFDERSILVLLLEIRTSRWNTARVRGLRTGTAARSVGERIVRIVLSQ